MTSMSSSSLPSGWSLLAIMELTSQQWLPLFTPPSQKVKYSSLPALKRTKIIFSDFQENFLAFQFWRILFQSSVVLIYKYTSKPSDIDNSMTNLKLKELDLFLPTVEYPENIAACICSHYFLSHLPSLSALRVIYIWVKVFYIADCYRHLTQDQCFVALPNVLRQSVQ